MRYVIWKDGYGKKHRSLVRDNDPDTMAKHGIPSDPPDITMILEDAKTELHNALIERGLFTWQDVQREQNSVTSAILAVLRNKILTEYKVKEVRK